MPSRATDETSRRAFLRSPAAFGLSAIDRDCVARLIGHSLARIEREFILQTLRHNQGNRTRTAALLGISVRSLRDRIRNYKSQGEYVPDPGASESTAADFRH
jgi:DNA-binding NtrC family response regulator